MKSELVNQPDWRPTRKHFIGAIGGIATAFLVQFTDDLATNYEVFRFLATDVVKGGLPVIAYFGVGYYFKERAQ